MNRSLPRPSVASALLTATVALWSATASADGGCRTPFDNAGCFALETLALAFLSSPVTVGAAAVILVVGLRRAKARSTAVVLTALGVVPVVLATGLATATFARDAGLSSLLALVAAAGIYAALALRWLTRSAARA